tara:strand:+ start:11121 stop:11318 length:198 start_codon:yes stop_codon:yes gene_type:complete
MNNLTNEEEARWLCLFDAVNYISAKAEKLGVKSESYLKPLPIEKYVKERYPAVFKDLEFEKQGQE